MTLHTADTGSRRRFELKRRIGAGALGEVYLAEQVGAGGFRRPVALKLLNETASRMKEAARRMRDEARILGRLQHRHLVDVLDLVQLGERWAVVMAYVPGADLEQVLLMLESEGGRVPGTASLEIGCAVAKALHAAWSAEDENGQTLQVVHRDIKPSNVRVTPDGEIKVLDFGVARVRMAGREAETRRRGMMGTERYMAPERILMEGDGPEGDVYALGATVAELMLGVPIGRTPVRDEKHLAFVEDIVTRVRAVLEGPAPVVEETATLIGRTLAADPADRPTARDLSVSFDSLSRSLKGPTLTVWAMSIVDRVPAALGTGSGEVVTGTLIEGSDLSSMGGPAFDAPPGADGSRAPTYVQEESGPGMVGGLLIVGVVLLLVAVALFGLSTTTEPETAAVVEAPVEPAVIPAVVETPEPEPAPADAAAPDGDGATEAEAAAEPAPEPVAAPPTRRTEAAPRPAPAPKPAPAPEPAGSPDPEPAIPADAPRVSRALVLVDDVGSFEVTCADRAARGTASARIADFVAGTCTVKASRGGDVWTARVRIEAPREVRCAIAGETMTCR